MEAVMKAGMRLIQTHKLCSFYDDKQKAKRSEGDYTHTEKRRRPTLRLRVNAKSPMVIAEITLR